jgi:cellulose synthase/poly-beta-1,6-N-acetylglucosamine synthase-like glycosyltransferase
MIDAFILVLIAGVVLRDVYYFVLYLFSLRRSRSHGKYTGKYTIIIPHYNKKEVDRCLTNLYPDDIVVVDDGSHQTEILKRWEDKVTVHYLEHRGKYHALNYGVDHSSGDIVIVDADTFVTRESLRSILQQLAESDAVAGNIHVYKEHSLVSSIQAVEHIRIAMFNRIALFKGKINFIPGPFAAFKRKIFEKERFTPSKVEDLTFSECIKDTFTLTYAPDAVAYTVMPQGFRSLYAQRKYWARGNIEELTAHRILSYYLLAAVDILILAGSFLTGAFIPLAAFFIFESFTMIVANQVEKGKSLYESIFFPFFMYFLAFFYIFVYMAAFMEKYSDSYS